MKEIENIFSIVLSNTQDYDMLTYIDIDCILDKNDIYNYINNMVNKHNILKNKIIHTDKLYFSEINNFKIKNYYKIKDVIYTEFNKYIGKLLNRSFKTESRWFFYFCIDKINCKSRMYFKIDHAYADGHKIIEMLTNENITTKLKKETTLYNRIYSIIIGTIILLLSYIYSFLNIFKKKNISSELSSYKTSYIVCPKLNLNKIKSFCKKKKITVNDFLYTLMIKSHYLYTNEKKTITICSPINISKNEHENNMCPLFLSFDNTLNIDKLFDKVHQKFNICKYSLFIPLLFPFMNIIPKIIKLSTMSYISANLLKNCDLTFSNIIGPTLSDTSRMVSNESVNNIHFLTISPNLTYNIISYKNNVNITLTFKTGIIKNKTFYKKCILESYNELISS